MRGTSAASLCRKADFECYFPVFDFLNGCCPLLLNWFDLSVNDFFGNKQQQILIFLGAN
jgi:hypothetical protein